MNEHIDRLVVAHRSEFEMRKVSYQDGRAVGFEVIDAAVAYKNKPIKKARKNIHFPSSFICAMYSNYVFTRPGLDWSKYGPVIITMMKSSTLGYGLEGIVFTDDSIHRVVTYVNDLINVLVGVDTTLPAVDTYRMVVYRPNCAVPFDKYDCNVMRLSGMREKSHEDEDEKGDNKDDNVKVLYDEYQGVENSPAHPTLANFLKEKNLLNPKVIDEISIHCAKEDDMWYCSDCLEDGGYDMPTTNPCTGACYRSYCDECRKKRNDLCKCGDSLYP